MPGGRVVDAARKREQNLQRSGGSGELRQGNLTQILRYLRDHGASSRHDIARGCGLGVSTMTDLVGDLRTRRLVLELDPVRRPGAGRPTRPIALDGGPWAVLGVQVTPDHLEVLAATVGGAELWRDRVLVGLDDPAAAPGAVADALLRQLDRLPGGTTLVAVEVGVPGPVDDDGVVSARTLGWSQVPLAEVLGTALTEGGRPGVRVGVSSDCHLAGLYVARTELPDPGHQVAAYLGGIRDVGSALVVHGEIFRGAAGGAGDLGHLHVQAEGPGCWCGRHGCLNSLLSTEHLLARSELLSPEEAAQLVAEQPAKAVAVLEEAASEGEHTVLRVLGEAGDALGRAVDDILGVVNPDAVILGGYLGRLAPYLLPALDRRLHTRGEDGPYADTQVLALDEGEPQVAAGAVLAARDACLYDPLGLTAPVG